MIGYGELGGGRRPAFFRAAGPAGLQALLDAGDVVPLYGPAALHPTAGAVLLGVRPPLVAFNVDLRTADVGVARAVAAAVRERDGGLRGVQALGLLLAAHRPGAGVDEPDRPRRGAAARGRGRGRAARGARTASRWSGASSSG